MYNISFIHASVDGHLGCFHVLAIVNSTAVNIGEHVSLWTMFFSGYMPSSGIAGSYDSCIFNFLRNLHTPAPAFMVCGVFGDGHSGWREVISHCSFDSHFSTNQRCWASFHVPLGHLYVPFFFLAGAGSVWDLISQAGPKIARAPNPGKQMSEPYSPKDWKRPRC